MPSLQSEANLFSFRCSVFESTVAMRDCATIDYHHTRGDHRKIEGRKGCQAAMRCGKCPVHVLLRRARSPRDLEPYISAEERTGSLDKDVVAIVEPVLMREQVIDQFGVDGFERDRLLALTHGAGEAKRGKAASKGELAPVKRAAKPKPAEPAPIASDMSAAITKAVARAADAPPAAAKPAPVAMASKSPTPAPGARLSLLELARQRRSAA